MDRVFGRVDSVEGVGNRLGADDELVEDARVCSLQGKRISIDI